MLKCYVADADANRKSTRAPQLPSGGGSGIQRPLQLGGLTMPSFFQNSG